MKYHNMKKIARRLRNNQTHSEKRLWSKLRKRKIFGYKFLRQHPIIYDSNNDELFFYIPDFYCSSLNLIIELDGKIHENQVEYDQKRDATLREMNINILRIKNEELNNINKVIEKIENYIKKITTPPLSS
jgi:very-short-patch-repair endonuclease